MTAWWSCIRAKPLQGTFASGTINSICQRFGALQRKTGYKRGKRWVDGAYKNYPNYLPLGFEINLQAYCSWETIILFHFFRFTATEGRPKPESVIDLYINILQTDTSGTKRIKTFSLLFGHPYLKLKPTTNMYNAVSKYLELTNRLTSP